MKRKNRNWFFFERRFLGNVEESDDKNIDVLEEPVAQFLDQDLTNVEEALSKLNEEAENREAKVESVYNIQTEALQKLSSLGSKKVVGAALKDLAEAQEEATFRIGKWKFWRTIGKLRSMIPKNAVETDWRREISITEYSKICDRIEIQQRKIQILEARREKKEARIDQSISNLQMAREKLEDEDSWFWQKWGTSRRFKKSIKRLEKLKGGSDKIIDEASKIKKEQEDEKIKTEELIRESTDKLYKKFKDKFVAPLQEMRLTRDSLKVDLARIDADLDGETTDKEKKNLSKVRSELISLVNGYDKKIMKKEANMEKWLNRDNVFQRNTILALRGFMEKENNYAAINWKERYRGHEEIKNKQILIDEIMKGMNTLDYKLATKVYNLVIKSDNIPARWMEVFRNAKYSRVLEFLVTGNVDGRKIVVSSSKLLKKSPEMIVKFLESPFLFQALDSIGNEEKFAQKRSKFLDDDMFKEKGLSGFMNFIISEKSLDGPIKKRIRERLQLSGINASNINTFMRNANLNDLAKIPWNILEKKDCAKGMNVIVYGDRALEYNGFSPKWIGRNNPDLIIKVMKINNISKVLSELAGDKRRRELWKNFVDAVDEAGYEIEDYNMIDFLNYVSGNYIQSEASAAVEEDDDVPKVLDRSSEDSGSSERTEEPAKSPISKASNSENNEKPKPKEVEILRDFIKDHKSGWNFRLPDIIFSRIEKEKSSYNIEPHWDNLRINGVNFFYDSSLGFIEAMSFKNIGRATSELLTILKADKDLLEKLGNMEGQTKLDLKEFLRYKAISSYTENGRKIPSLNLVKVFNEFFTETPENKEERKNADKLNDVLAGQFYLRYSPYAEINNRFDFYKKVKEIIAMKNKHIVWDNLESEGLKTLLGRKKGAKVLGITSVSPEFVAELLSPSFSGGNGILEKIHDNFEKWSNYYNGLDDDKKNNLSDVEKLNLIKKSLNENNEDE